jgi:hypothetical protein
MSDKADNQYGGKIWRQGHACAKKQNVHKNVARMCARISDMTGKYM